MADSATPVTLANEGGAPVDAQEGLGDVSDVGEALYALLSVLVRQQPREISVTAVSTLSTLRSEGPQRITALATIQGVSQPAMTNLIASLEKSGFVVRRRDPSDGRVSVIELTDAGLEYVLGRRREGSERVGRHLAHLPEDQRAALVAAVPALWELEKTVRGAETHHR
ncbi:MarR family winged helix-turn-helix transcriptional regulator [Gordonia polyisoprenivorans]|uniref:MarR family winged helix-turn-helix transcriptional regulator n=1 Tax=Gordonia polyisoprenivorans TaxID=84595 RepID=UPI00230163C9|nr:MarR family transcriptional regulator [Gordonia polyisoprenivorans]WCB38993.1 MarR family transcriptional regulator [Gordonia polyisoprenivorans]